jgi:hypothetical protein
MGAFFGVVVMVDRFREPRRDPRRVAAVVDERTYRAACRRFDQLLQLGELVRARSTAIAIRCWLRSEIHTGRRSRRVRRAAQLEQWELRLGRVSRISRAAW